MKIILTLVALILICGGLLWFSLRKGTSNEWVEAGSSGSPTMPFRIELYEDRVKPYPDLPSFDVGGTWKVYRATFSNQGKEASFLVAFDEKFASSKNSPLQWTKLAIGRVPHEDPDLLLEGAARALLTDAPGTEEAPGKTSLLIMDSVILGEKLDPNVGMKRNPRGGFSGRAGGWIPMKAFIPNAEGGTSEFYLNLNPKLGLGEILSKDEAYGPSAIRALAGILRKNTSTKSTIFAMDDTDKALIAIGNELYE